MKQIFCFCCKRSTTVELNGTNGSSAANSPADSQQQIHYIANSSTLAADFSGPTSRSRTTSGSSSMKSIKSFYSAKSRSSNADDFYSICSADSIKSERAQDYKDAQT